MAKCCVKCGKKVSILSNDPMELSEGRILCYTCAEPVNNKINALYYVETDKEFELLKNEILKECSRLYSDRDTKDIEKKIETIYSGSGNDVNKNYMKKIIESHMMTTGYEFAGYKITKYVGVISGQVALGTGFLSDSSAAIADLFGVESNRIADKLEEAKNTAMEKLIMKSNCMGGNAIIGVDFDYITFAHNMIGVVANGTSVVVEKIEE